MLTAKQMLSSVMVSGIKNKKPREHPGRVWFNTI